MIGDLVRFDNSVNFENPEGNGKYVNCRVKSIGGLAFGGRTRFIYLDKANRKKPLIGGDDFQRTLGELSPIPITVKILKKNGFEKQDDGWYKMTLEEENLIGVQPFENVNWIFGANVFPNIIEHIYHLFFIFFKSFFINVF